MSEFKRATSMVELYEKMRNFRTSAGEAYGLAYQPAPTDIFIATPAKCGTTWMQQIVHGLRTRGSMDFDEITRVVPWIDMAFDMGMDIYAPQRAQPRAFKTHQNLNALPKGGKYIVVVRDPKDAALSLYRFLEGWTFEKGTIPIDTFLRGYYIEGYRYWQHVLALWPRRQDRDVLALSYEGMKEDLPGTIARVAAFMGIVLDDELKEIVLQQSDIQFMKAHNRQFDDHLVRQTRNPAIMIPADGVTSKVKLGKVGEARQSLSQDLLDEFDHVWQTQITARIGLRSYDDLREELA